MSDTTNMMGLATWDQQLDRYDYLQLSNNWQILDFHDHSSGRGVQIAGGGIAAGSIALQHLAPVLAQDLGINASGTTGRGVVRNVGPGTLTNTIPGSLSDAADSVGPLQLNANGLIIAIFHGLWSVSSGGTANAGLYLNNVAVGVGNTINGAAAPASVSTTATNPSPLYTNGGTLATNASTTTAATDIATGQTVGGSAAHIFVTNAPGTYTVSVQYWTSAGATVTVTNRRLWAWTVNFT